VGPHLAHSILSAHERTSGNQPAARAMDVHNNLVGIQIGLSYRASEKQYADIIVHALRDGWLIVIEP
jgi:hypothetical protein